MKSSSGNPKAKTVHQRTLELFRRWGRGMPGKLRAAAPLGADFPSTILYVTRLTGELITALRNATPADSGNRLSPERTLRIPQSFLEPVLREEVRQMPSVIFGSAGSWNASNRMPARSGRRSCTWRAERARKLAAQYRGRLRRRPKHGPQAVGHRAASLDGRQTSARRRLPRADIVVYAHL